MKKAMRREARGRTPLEALLLRTYRTWLPAMVLYAFAGAQPANAFYIQLHGVVTEYFSGDPMRDVQVRIVKDSIERETAFTGRKGKYEFFLDRGYDYKVWFYKEGMVTKHIRIDARDIPLLPDVPFYEMFVQMTMFTWIDGMDFDLFELPVGMALYKHSVRNLTWNVEYTETLRTKLARLMTAYERAVGRLERARRDKKRKRMKRRKDTPIF